MTVKGAIRELMGERAFTRFCSYRDRMRRRSTTTLRIGNFDLTFPGDHILPLIHAIQPYRHLALGILAGELSKRYPGEAFVDIGANVGDTAAMVASHSNVPLILVEPSDIYFDFLKKNVSVFPNPVELHKAFIFSDAALCGGLVHAGGSARFDKNATNETKTPREHLAQIAGKNCRLIKVDTDGHDFPIITSSLEFLEERLPCLYFENEIHDCTALSDSNILLEKLESIGYGHFLVFEAGGLHMVTTSDVSVLRHLNRYILNAEVRRRIHNYDIVCLPHSDADVAVALTSSFSDDLSLSTPTI